MPKKLIGQTILKINGKTVFEKKNALTKWVYTALIEGNFQNYMQQRNILPLSQWFSGCLLFDRNMKDIQTTVNICMPDSGAKVVAQAGDDDGTQSNNLKRGSKDTFRVLPNGIEHSWQWTANRGNGTIGAVALTRANNGRVQIAESYTEAGMNERNYMFEILSKTADNSLNNAGLFPASSSDPDILEASQGIMIIDWEKEIGYRVDQNYDSTENVNTIRIRAYKISTKYTHLNGKGGCVENATPLVDESYVGLLPYSSTAFSYTYQGKYIFCIVQEGGVNFKILKVNTEDWTATPFSFSFPTANIGNHGTTGKDCFPMYYTEVNGVVTEWYMFANRERELNPYRLTVARLNLLDNTFKVYDRPIDSGYNQQLACYMLPNGDWIQPAVGANYGSLYSKEDDKFYACAPFNQQSSFASYQGAATYGTVLVKNSGNMGLCQTYPCISTINNLDSLVTKRTGDIMQLIYRILEIEEGEEE